jgi:pimeloyl-ACP methyl ester carboxylesterase
MNRKFIISGIVSTLTVLGLGLVITHTVSGQEGVVEGNYASVNGLEMYYEIHGEGEPLILLHGGLGGIVEFSQLLPALAETRQVIAVELQGHGHTADIDRPITFENLADDVAALISELGYEKADVMGFSFGGSVALQTAIRHPEVVDRLILVSTSFRRAGLHEAFQMGMSQMSAESANMMLETPMYQFYSSVAPEVEDWSTLVGKMGQVLNEAYDFSEDIPALTMPVLIIAGDSDMFPPTYAVELFELLGGGVAGGFAEVPASQLAILPNTIHFAILSRTDLLLPIINPFLDAAAPEATQ